MKTSAQLLAWSGTIVRDAQARSQAIDPQGHMVPVLIVDIRLDDAPDQNPMRLVQPFPAGQDVQCQAAARRLRKGTHITAQGPRAQVHLRQDQVLHIHVHQPEETTV